MCAHNSVASRSEGITNTKWERNKSSLLLQKQRGNITLIYILEVIVQYKKKNVWKNTHSCCFLVWEYYTTLSFLHKWACTANKCLLFKLSLTIATTVQQTQDRSFQWRNKRISLHMNKGNTDKSPTQHRNKLVLALEEMFSQFNTLLDS